MLELRNMTEVDGKSRRRFAEENNLNEATLRNYLLYARAADMRKRYAADAADEQIRGLSVVKVREYVKLPDDKRDEWLDRGASSDEAKHILKAARKGPKATKGRTELKLADTPAQPTGRPGERNDASECEGEPGSTPAEDGQNASNPVAETPKQADEPLSEQELEVVSTVLGLYQAGRPCVRRKILAGLAAQPDAVKFMRNMLRTGADGQRSHPHREE